MLLKLYPTLHVAVPYFLCLCNQRYKQLHPTLYATAPYVIDSCTARYTNMCPTSYTYVPYVICNCVPTSYMVGCLIWHLHHYMVGCLKAAIPCVALMMSRIDHVLHSRITLQNDASDVILMMYQTNHVSTQHYQMIIRKFKYRVSSR